MIKISQSNQLSNLTSVKNQWLKTIDSMGNHIHSPFDAESKYKAIVYFQSNLDYDGFTEEELLPKIKLIENLRAYFLLWIKLEYSNSVDDHKTKKQIELEQLIEIEKEKLIAPEMAMQYYKALNFFQMMSRYKFTLDEENELRMHVTMFEGLREYFLLIHRYHFEGNGTMIVKENIQ